MSEAERIPIDGAVSNSGVTWTVESDGVAVITFDSPGSSVNLISLGALMALEDAVGFLERRPGVRGAILRSGKPSTFIAGADVTQIASVGSARDAVGKSMAGQRVFGLLEALPFPTVAAISGVCLGGGLELSLACTARVAAEADAVQIGLPEVKLGLIPGWGGTQRLPRLITLPAALDLILTGRGLDARKALKAGLVDRLSQPERLVAAARRLIDELQGLDRRSARAFLRPPSLSERLSRTAPIRAFILSRARARARRASGGHYPAPDAAVDAIGHGLGAGLAEGLRREAESISGLVTGPVAKNLIAIFLSSRETGGQARVAARKVRSVGVLGAGVMGGSIAAVALAKRIPVRLRDVAPEPLEKGVAHAHAILSRRGRRRRPAAWVQPRFTMLAPALTLDGFGGADLVIEAVVENLDVKRRVLAEVEKAVPDSCILASNTSSLSIGAMAQALQRPGRLVGLHFFNPAERMPLVEVVRGPGSDDEAVFAAAAFSRALGKTPVVVKDAPGFVVNRLLMPYLAEALAVLEEGGGIEEIDRSLVRFGMPMGPFALLDQIGLDVAAHVASVLAAAFGERLPSPRSLAAMADAGLLGAKSGKGFYVHAGKRRTPNAEAPALFRRAAASGSPPGGEELIQRLLFPILNEAARLLDEGVAESAAAVDLAMVFGTGFPPFLGGPLRWADALGLARVVDGLERMAGGAKPRLAPSRALRSLAASPGRFHAA